MELGNSIQDYCVPSIIFHQTASHICLSKNQEKNGNLLIAATQVAITH